MGIFHDLTMIDMVDEERKINYFGSGVAYFPAQANDPACEEAACNIHKICETMTDTSLEPIQRLAKLRTIQQESMPSMFEDHKVTRKNTTAKANSELGWEDYWTYQTCKEFGFYQTCSVGSDCMFVQGLMTAYYSGFEYCKNTLGLTKEDVDANIEKTNAHYGGIRPNMTRVMWVNGEIDPWASQAVLNTTLPGQSTLWVSGASHHAWTHPSLPTDCSSIVNARKSIFAQVLKWLAM